MTHRIHNFNAGPAAIPLPVLEQIQEELLDYRGSGMSVMEMSHRSKPFDLIMEEVVSRFRKLTNLPDEFHVLFIQGGASMQFAMIPMNFCAGKRPVYLDTGTWSAKAIKEAEIQGVNPLVAASSKDRNFAYIPKEYVVPGDAAYFHITSNNTIKGTQMHVFPQVDVPLIGDMSSDILSRPFDARPFGFFYAGAQKNLGPSGVCLAVVREDMVDRCPDTVPTMLRYKTYVEKNSLYNTPPSFGIYVISLVLKWLDEDMGGLEKMAAINRKKADALYGAMEASGGFYRPTADPEDRSNMNVTFRLKEEDLEAKFVAEAQAQGLGGLKGHRSVGGCRASIYNATGQDAIDALVGFMADFARRNG